VATVIALQRTAGNALVSRLIASGARPPDGGATLARWTAPVVTLKDDEELIRDALAGDETAMIEIQDYGKVKPGDRLSFIQTLLGGSVTGREEDAITRMWNTWSGVAFIETASANIDLWKRSVEECDALANHPEVEKIKRDFLGAVRDTVSGYLRENRGIVDDELKKYAVAEGQTPTAEQEERVRGTQALLELVADAQTQLNALRGVNVGYVDAYDPREPRSSDPLAGGERKTRQLVPFVPGNPPPIGPSGEEPEAVLPYEMVMSAHEGLVDRIGDLAKGNPAVYAVVSRGGGDPASATEVSQASTDEARKQIEETLRDVLKNIEKTRGKLEDEDFLLKLGPVHRQLQGGAAFSNELAKATVQRAIEDVKNAEFWRDLGLGTLAAAAFVVGSLASGGLAAVALGTGLAASAGGAALKVSEHDEMKSAKGTAVSSETEIVDQGKVDEEKLKMVMAVAMAILDAATIAVKLIKPVVGITVNWSKRLSSAGNAGAQCIGVFDATHYGFGPKAVVKVFRTETAEETRLFLTELEAARAAGTGKNSAKFLGEVPIGKPGQRGYAMSKVEGGFTEAYDLPGMSAKEIERLEAVAGKHAANVRSFTAQDVRAYGKQLVDKGYVSYDIQGLVGPDGHWRAIDFGGVRKLPPASDPEYALMVARHNDMVEREAGIMEALARQNPTTPPAQ
jgi:hypothetical protein